MNPLNNDLQASKGLVNDERWQLVLRVAASEEIRRAARLRDFLLFICNNALQEHPKEIHEQDIGCAVFDRRAAYNPAEDNIVRVQARELRKRLEQYFAGVGREESLEICIPKGSYVPIFRARQQEPGESLPSGDIPFAPVVPSSDRRIAYSLLGLLLIAITFGLWQWKAKQELQRMLAVSAERGLAPQSLLWPRLFDPKYETYIVGADTNWCLLQRLVRREFSLNDYVSPWPVTGLDTRELKIIARGRYTGMADLSVLTGILHASALFQAPTRVRYARDISIDDLKPNNFILIGGQCSDPWGELFSSTANFRYEIDFGSDTTCYVDKKPLQGEPARYCNQEGPKGHLESYCLISFVPNLNRSGNGLIIAGTSSEGTQVGGEFLASPELDSKLREYLKLRSQETNLPYFELLLKTSGGVPGGPLRPEYVTHRILTMRNK